MIDWDTLVTGPCIGIFGEAVTYAAVDRLPQQVTGVFDEAYLPVEPLGNLGREIGMPAHISEQRPVLGVQLAQFLYLPAQGDAVMIRGVLYAVREVQADGHGWAKLMLNVAE